MDKIFFFKNLKISVIFLFWVPEGLGRLKWSWYSGRTTMKFLEPCWFSFRSWRDVLEWNLALGWVVWENSRKIPGPRNFPENSTSQVKSSRVVISGPERVRGVPEKFHHPVDFPESSRVALSGPGRVMVKRCQPRRPRKIHHPRDFFQKVPGWPYQVWVGSWWPVKFHHPGFLLSI